MKNIDFEIISKEEAYWKTRIESSENIIKTHEEAIKESPQHIDFHKKIIKMCEEELKLIKSKQEVKNG